MSRSKFILLELLVIQYLYEEVFRLYSGGDWPLGTTSFCLAFLSLGVPGAAVICLTAGVILLLVASKKTSGSLKGVDKKAFLTLGILEALNFGFYALALNYSSVPVAVATHLTAPLFLLAHAFYRGEKSWTPVYALIIALIVAAVSLIFFGSKETGSELLGAVFGFISAGFLAVLIYKISQSASKADPLTGAGVQITTVGVLLTPLIIFSLIKDFDPQFLISSCLIGIILFAPAFWLYWKGMASSKASFASIVGLNELVVSTALAFIVFNIIGLDGIRITVLSLIPALLLLAAVVIEIYNRDIKEET